MHWKKEAYFECSECGKKYEISGNIWKCRCGNPLNLMIGAEIDIRRLENRERTIWRYFEVLPIEDPSSIISFKEGFTPLLRAELFNREVLLKMEYLFPTGSFKDRGSSVMISKLRELGVREIVEDSSGNAGASISAYSARAKIKCHIFVPERAPETKITQIEFFGAEIHRIKGSRDEVAERAREFAENRYYASHSWNPFFLHGTKTFAYEIVEQLNWKIPDAIIFPVGNGTLLLGAYIGFRELREIGLIEEIPRLIGAQSSSCAPLFRAFRENSKELPEVEMRESIADGISVSKPVRWREILRAIRETDGEVIAVEESEIIEALKELGRNGFYVEPTSAVPLAALRRIEGREDFLIPLTGSGLKLGDRMRGFL
ncbi:MAG: threonine synthase [Archaeoglobi archaeon]|nr:threonine synthase [Candidatus Mnemosynella sp.]